MTVNGKKGGECWSSVSPASWRQRGTMLRLATFLLAKKPLPKRGRGATAPRRVTKAPTKRQSSSRSASPKRQAPSSKVAKNVKPTSNASGKKMAARSPTPKVKDSVAPPIPSAPAVVPVPVETRPPFCLATAVSTVIVPPSANALLEGMKQTITPMVRRANDGGVSGSSSSSGSGDEGKEPISQLEEFYTSKKGPLFATAVIAGTNAVKQASQLIPFCHPMRIQKCSFTFRRRVVAGINRTSPLPHRLVLRKRTSPPPPPSRARGECSVLYCFCTVATDDPRTGVEVEAMTGANVAALTLYDMLKGLPGSQEDGLGIGESFVLAKRGSKADFTKLLVSETEPAPPPREAHVELLPQRQEVSECSSAERPAQASALLELTGTVEEPKSSEEERNGDDEEYQQNSQKEEMEKSTIVETVSAPAEMTKTIEKVEVQPNKTEKIEKFANESPARRVEANERSKGKMETAAGEERAWWKSTPQEKRHNQLHPRQRFELSEQRTKPRAKNKQSGPKKVPSKRIDVKKKGSSNSKKTPVTIKKKGTTTAKVSAVAARNALKRRPIKQEPPKEEYEQQQEEEETPVQVEEDIDEWDGDNNVEAEEKKIKKTNEKGAGKSAAGARGRKDPPRKATGGNHQRKSVAAEEPRMEYFEEKEDEMQEEVQSHSPPTRSEKRKTMNVSPPPRSSSSSGSQRKTSREENDLEEVAMVVNHDSWDTMTHVETEYDQEIDDMHDYTEEAEDDEEIPPMPKKKQNKAKSPKAAPLRRKSSR